MTPARGGPVDRYHSAEIVRSQSGRQYHIGLGPGEAAPSILLCGDPARARKVADRFDRVRLRRQCREYVTFTGLYKGLPLTVMGTGIGPDNMEIAVVELSQLVPRGSVVIRIGSCGALQPQVELGDLVVTRRAVRLENTTDFFVPKKVKALAHPRVLRALEAACAREGLRSHVGTTATAPGFYGAQGRTVPGFKPRFPGLPDALARRGVLNLEMEISVLFVLARLAGLRAGAVCAVYANRPRNVFIDSRAKDLAESRCIAAGLAACEILAGRKS